MFYDRSTVTNREQFIDNFPELLKQFEQHQQIYRDVSISSFLISLKSTLENEPSKNGTLQWEEMTCLLEQALFIPTEVNDDRNL